MTATATHTAKIITMGNGGAKARRPVCSCGHLGPRYAFGPLAGGRSIQAATAKAEAEIASDYWAAHMA